MPICLLLETLRRNSHVLHLSASDDVIKASNLTQLRLIQIQCALYLPKINMPFPWDYCRGTNIHMHVCDYVVRSMSFIAEDSFLLSPERIFITATYHHDRLPTSNVDRLLALAFADRI